MRNTILDFSNKKQVTNIFIGVLVGGGNGFVACLFISMEKEDLSYECLARRGGHGTNKLYFPSWRRCKMLENSLGKKWNGKTCSFGIQKQKTKPLVACGADVTRQHDPEPYIALSFSAAAFSLSVSRDGGNPPDQ